MKSTKIKDNTIYITDIIVFSDDCRNVKKDKEYTVTYITTFSIILNNSVVISKDDSDLKIKCVKSVILKTKNDWFYTEKSICLSYLVENQRIYKNQKKTGNLIKTSNNTLELWKYFELELNNLKNNFDMFSCIDIKDVKNLVLESSENYYDPIIKRSDAIKLSKCGNKIKKMKAEMEIAKMVDLNLINDYNDI